MSKPIEKPPTNPLLHGYYATLNYRVAHQVDDGETWESVAHRFMVDVKELIHFNFHTLDPDEINWYLNYYVGCDKPSDSGNNWKFSRSARLSRRARPGIIFIPPVEHDPIDMDPDVLYTWTAKDVEKFKLRLKAVAQGMSGNAGERIKKLVKVILRAGYPGCKNLWYFNPSPILKYLNVNPLHTNNKERLEMTMASQGVSKFDGDAGVNYGNWRFYPVPAMLDEFASGYSDTAALIRRLEQMEDMIWQGWHTMILMGINSDGDVSSTYGDLVSEFMTGARILSKDSAHLYSAFRGEDRR